MEDTRKEALGNGLMEVLGSTPTGAEVSQIMWVEFKTNYDSIFHLPVNGMI